MLVNHIEGVVEDLTVLACIVQASKAGTIGIPARGGRRCDRLRSGGIQRLSDGCLRCL